MSSKRQQILPSQSVRGLVAPATAVLYDGLVCGGSRASVLHGLAKYLTSLALELRRYDGYFDLCPVITVQGVPSGLTNILRVPNSACADGYLAEEAEQLGSRMEQTNQSQLNLSLQADGTPCTKKQLIF